MINWGSCAHGYAIGNRACQWGKPEGLRFQIPQLSFKVARTEFHLQIWVDLMSNLATSVTVMTSSSYPESTVNHTGQINDTRKQSTHVTRINHCRIHHARLALTTPTIASTYRTLPPSWSVAKLDLACAPASSLGESWSDDGVASGAPVVVPWVSGEEVSSINQSPPETTT
jgi:hypothetical protein